jgi:hypothetical protein
MSRIARLIGVDDYPESPLYGCVADAEALGSLLARHDDGSVNFHCRTMINGQVTRTGLRQAVQEVFGQRDVDLALFFFAGHGLRRGNVGDQHEGLLVTVDTEDGDEGVPMEWVIAQANNSPAKERVIMLDCCHAGAIDQVLATRTPVFLKEGVSILAACRSDQYAQEKGEHGLFTSLVCTALNGGAADIRGFVTVASIYAYVDELLTPWDQRPLFRASVAGLRHIRRAKPAVSDEMLRHMSTLFTSDDYQYPLDKSYEPEQPSHDPGHVQIFALLQRLRAARLVEPIGTEHMYHAAIQNKSCQLTALGRAYWHQARNGRF